ncbi:LemA family protein, partial [bacterium]|nr:LemA family protein [bacterium]
VVVFLGGGLCSSYNNMVRLNKDVDEKWANIETQLTRRSDLIPNLVATVKAYAKQEETVLTEVTRARAGLDNARTMEEISKANGDLNQALSRLMVVVEAYPELKSNENFLQLQAQLEGTENRINYARMEYNKSVKSYNTAIAVFPGSIIAGIFGFKPRESFEASERERQNPDVKDLFEG